MRTERILSVVLATLLLAFVTTLAVMPASAAGIPCDDDGDNELTKDELVNAILPYMLEKDGAHTLDEVGDAAWVYAYWSGVPKTITDSIEREVTIYRPIERMVVTDDNHAELIRLIGAENKVVGIEGSIPDRGYFPVMSDKTDIGNQWSGLNYELIAELNPDVVIMLGLPFVPVDPVLKKLNEIGVKAVCIDPIDIDKRADVIMLLGYILEETERATEYCVWRGDKLSIISGRLEGLDEEDEPKTIAKDTDFRGVFGKGYTMSKTIEMAGMNNTADFYGLQEVAIDWILEMNPEIFLLGDWKSEYVGYTINSPSKAEEDIKDEIDKPGFDNITAVIEGDVYEVEYMLLGTRGDIGVLYLAKIAYPEKFEDIDPVEIHREYFEDWLRVDYQGIFFYPHTWEQNGGD